MADRVHPSGAAYATWWSRVGAELIDLIVFIVVGAVLGILLGAGTMASAASSIFILAYNAYLDGGETGQTLGKRLVGIRVRADEATGPIGLGRGFIRAAFPALLGVGFYFDDTTAAISFFAALGNALWPLWDVRRQTWHDKAARSVVLQAREIDVVDEPVSGDVIDLG